MLKSLIFVNMKWLAASMFPSGNKSGKPVSKSKKAVKGILIGLLAIYIVAVLLLSTGMFFTSFASAFGGGELRWFYFAFVALTVFIFTFIGSVFTTQNLLFKAKDNELLLSMPIPVGMISASRLCVILALNLIYALMVSAPACVVFFILYGFNIGILLLFIVTMTATVVISTAVTCFLGWAIALISSKLRKSNVFQTVFSLLFFGAYIFVFSNIQSNINLLVANGEAIASAVKKFMPFFYLVGKTCAESSLSALLACVIIATVPLALACLLISKSFIKITTIKKGSKKKEYVAKEMKTASAKNALLKKELSRFFTLPIYILNCATGGLMAVMIAIFAAIKGETILTAFAMPEVENLGNIFPVVIAIAFAFCAGMCNSASASISLEGTKIDVLRAMPVRANDFYFAKFASNYVLGFVPITLSVIIAGAGLKLGIALTLATLASSLAFLALSSLINLLCNTLMPKFRWNSEAVIIKQSASVAVAMLATIAACATIYAPYFAVSKSVSPEIYLWIAAAISLLGCVILITYFKKNGKEKFNNMHS